MKHLCKKHNILREKRFTYRFNRMMRIFLGKLDIFTINNAVSLPDIRYYHNGLTDKKIHYEINYVFVTHDLHKTI